MEKLGTNYGGWYIPTDINLNKDSIIYSGGVGEDISFDILLQSKYDCNILLIDPTVKSVKHYEEVIQFYNNKKQFSGNIQPDYYSIISNYKPNLNKFTYLNEGLWNKKGTLKFYKQENDDYVSQSLINGMFGYKYDIINVNSIKNIMNNYNHSKIDMLKLDIEGSEITVLNQMLDDDIFPNYLCIEFDLALKGIDKNNDTHLLLKRLLTGNYKLLKNDNLNMTLKYNV